MNSIVLVHKPRNVTARPLLLAPRLLDPLRKRLRYLRYSLRTVQELLGPSDVSTTMICTHVLKIAAVGTASPQDTLARTLHTRHDSALAFSAANAKLHTSHGAAA